jgi:hypothetical protein
MLNAFAAQAVEKFILGPTSTTAACEALLLPLTG